MIPFRSNLKSPDLLPCFAHARALPAPHGHEIITDWHDKLPGDPVFGRWKSCGFWTVDEAAILYQCARARAGRWLDIGGYTGWTAAHLCAAGCSALSIEPMHKEEAFHARWIENLCAAARTTRHYAFSFPETSEEYFRAHAEALAGVVIDGDHDGDQPAADASRACHRTSLILLHDCSLPGPLGACRLLRDRGWRVRFYRTPNTVAVAWAGKFTPPEHAPDPNLQWQEPKI